MQNFFREPAPANAARVCLPINTTCRVAAEYRRYNEFQNTHASWPPKANELFAKLSETSDGALKTREKLFADLKAELELHTSKRCFKPRSHKFPTRLRPR